MFGKPWNRSVVPIKSCIYFAVYLHQAPPDMIRELRVSLENFRRRGIHY